MRRLGPALMPVVRPPGLNCWISFTPVFSRVLLLILYLCLITFWYLDWYVLVDGTLLSMGSSMRTKHLFVLIHIRNKGDVVIVKQAVFYTDHFKEVLLLWIVFVIYVSCLSCCLICSFLPCSHLLGKGWPLGSLICCLFLCFCHLHMWCPRSGLVFDCINS